MSEEVRAENCSDFSHISQKLRWNCSQVLWYNLNTKLSNKSEVVEVTKMMPTIGIITIVFAALTIYLCHDEYKNGKMSSKNFKIVAICEGLAILGMIFLIIS